MKLNELDKALQEYDSPVTEGVAGIAGAMGDVLQKGLQAIANFLHGLFAKEGKNIADAASKITNNSTSVEIIEIFVVAWNASEANNKRLPYLVTLEFNKETHCKKVESGKNADGSSIYKYTPIAIGYKITDVSDQILNNVKDAQVYTYGSKVVAKSTETK